MELWSNIDSKSQVINSIYEIPDGADVKIASAFFSDRASLDVLAERTNSLQLVFRLGYPTLINDIQGFDRPGNIQARYLTSRSFHPKLILVNNEYALLGSANFTGSGLKTNQELMIRVEEPSIIEELTSLFYLYWTSANPFTSQDLTKYRQHSSAFTNKIRNQSDEQHSSIESLFGKVEVDAGATKDSVKKSSFEDRYQKILQEYEKIRFGFYQIEKVYSQHDRLTESIPMAMEIDSFFNFVKTYHCKGKTKWKSTPMGLAPNLENLNRLITLWLTQDSQVKTEFLDHIVSTSYPLINQAFGTEQSIRNLSLKDLADTLMYVHSFSDQKQYAKKELGLVNKWINGVDRSTVHERLIHLLHGPDSIEHRIALHICHSDYKIYLFANSVVKEICGWVHTDSTPPFNDKSIEILRYFGFPNS